MDPASWRQIRGLIFDALQRPPSEREAFLRERCAEPILTESLSLLKACEADSTTLESLQSDTDDVEKADMLADLQPGTHVGQYVILDRLGRGGMGQVFLTRDQELHRKVALKCLLSSGADLERERARIKAEARAAAAITHANVAAIHHVIEHGTRAFIVMEYVEGESLSTRLKRERLTTEQVIAIGRQLVAALRAAHAQEVIHRDLKPGNIQLTPDGSVKVLDFGIAQTTWPMPTVSSTGSETAAATRFVGTRIARGGTPPYMSPEQLLGHVVDERSDIYSLGVVLFEMATGRRPYAGIDPFELVQAQVKGAPRADAIDPRVPRGLADVIAKALQIDLSLRYQTALEVGAALDAFEQTLRPKSVRVREQIRRWLARAAIALPTAVLGLGAIGFVATTGFNTTFGRTGEFARFGVEPLSSYFSWGWLAIFPSLVIMIFAVVSFFAGRFLFRALMLIGPLGHVGRRVRMTWSTIALKMGFDDPNVLAQALCCLGILFIVGLFWYRGPLIIAATSFFNSAPIDSLMPMGPKEYFIRQSYQVTLDVLTPAFAFGLWRVLQLRKLKNIRGGSLGVSLLIATMALIVLMRQWPYRTLNQRDFERVELAGARCYITGQSSDEYLVLCPGSSPPRNRAIKRDDPTLRRLHIVENVFNGVASPRSDP